MADSRRLSALARTVPARFGALTSPCVVALSGGPDSAVCAWAALEAGLTVRAVHVDHGLAGSPFVRGAAVAVAAFLDIPLHIAEVTVGGGSSPEGRARTARYEALEAALEPGELLLTGHTLSDQAETVLGNLLRGAGPDGLAGIPRRRGRIVRPLLDVTRSQTRELATLLGLPWVEDPVNLEAGPRRNLIRREAIPYLEGRFNPSLERALVRTADALCAHNEYLDRQADRVPVTVTGASVRLSAAILATIDPVIAVRAVRRAIRMIGGPHAGDARDVHLVLSVARGTQMRASLTGGLEAERRRALVVLSRPAAVVVPESALWTLPGSAVFGTWSFDAWVAEAPPAAFPVSRFVEVMDASAVPSAVTVRGVRTGDRIVIAGGHKDVAETLTEAGVPVSERPVWPVIVGPQEQVLWVPGVRRADLGWVDSATRRYLWVRATREDA
ncbi:MAG: tRNA lysidine(34) synthetase TilS [Actinobacteria bacterium]|nr:tRNA lysidine(34) synthetase TilS [Actinomycetota bacterium]